MIEVIEAGNAALADGTTGIVILSFGFGGDISLCSVSAMRISREFFANLPDPAPLKKWGKQTYSNCRQCGDR
jgi:hypothetical protein